MEKKCKYFNLEMLSKNFLKNKLKKEKRKLINKIICHPPIIIFLKLFREIYQEMILHAQEDVNRSLLDWPSPPSPPSPSDMGRLDYPYCYLDRKIMNMRILMCVAHHWKRNSQLNIDNCTHEGNDSSMNKLWIKDCFRDESTKEFIGQYGSHSSPIISPMSI